MHLYTFLVISSGIFLASGMNSKGGNETESWKAQPNSSAVLNINLFKSSATKTVFILPDKKAEAEIVKQSEEVTDGPMEKSYKSGSYAVIMVFSCFCLAMAFITAVVFLLGQLKQRKIEKDFFENDDI